MKYTILLLWKMMGCNADDDVNNDCERRLVLIVRIQYIFGCCYIVMCQS